jgi:hypothetical protein
MEVVSVHRGLEPALGPAPLAAGIALSDEFFSRAAASSESSRERSPAASKTAETYIPA